MSEQNNVYQFPNTPHNPNSEENINHEKGSNVGATFDNGECVEIDFRLAGEQTLSYEVAKAIQENKAKVDEIYTKPNSFEDGLVNYIETPIEALNKIEQQKVEFIAKKSKLIRQARIYLLSETFVLPDRIRDMQKGKKVS